jgi:DNA mismatch repair protein MutS2
VDSTTLEALEYHEVLSELSGFSTTPLGRAKILAEHPSTDITAVEERFKELAELVRLLDSDLRLPLGGIEDLCPILNRPMPEGSYLLSEELRFIGSTLSCLVLLKAVSSGRGREGGSEKFSRDYPRTDSAIETITDHSALSYELSRIFDSTGKIVDDASANLNRIRKEIRDILVRAREIMARLLRDRGLKELLQEEYATIREDRHVLAIKASKQSEFDGVVHGRSGSGETFFIEPMALVELNNSRSVLRRDEAIEEIAILRTVTADVGAFRAEILADIETAALLDALQSRALFSREISGVIPVLKSEGRIKLSNARHPLLELKAARGKGVAVPINIEIAEEHKVVVISGANTGGKTVALKTLGLLTLMAMSAIPISAGDGSEVRLFTHIMADIGDSQDIIASLSTFSAHIKRLGQFLSDSGPGSLVLVDEIGSGTDPSEGGALALSTLDTLAATGATSVVTTHLNMLKAHAQSNSAYLNVSVEFDEKTLHPLYTLCYGVPGPSLGLSIAKSLGLPAELVEKAQKYLGTEESAFIESVRMLEEEREELRQRLESATELERKRTEAVKSLREGRAELLAKVQGRIDAVVAEATKEIRRSAESIKFMPNAVPDSIAPVIKEINATGTRVIERITKVPRFVPSEGDSVTIKDLRQKGVVLSIDAENEKAEVRVGALKISVDFARLERTEGTKPGKGSTVKGRGRRGKSASQEVRIDADMKVSRSLNLLGMRVEEAEPLLNRFIDNAHAEGLDAVEVIHGIGTGRLKAGVDRFLSAHPSVRSFSLGDRARGGGGVTVVRLK